MPRAGTPFSDLLASLSGVLGRLFACPAFKIHSQQLLQDTQLCSGLLQLVLPGVSAMAVGLQLPPDRRPAECSWLAAVLMAVFVSACLRPMQRQQAITAGPDAGRRLLAAAAQLLQCCPFPAPAAAELAGRAALETTLYFIWQLEDAVLLQYAALAGLHQQPQAIMLPRRQAQLLLAALPKIGVALAAVAQTPGPILPQLARIVSAAAAMTTILANGARVEAGVARPAAAMASVQDLPAWLRAAAAALRWLPALVSIAGQEQHPQLRSSMQTYLVETASAVVCLALEVGGIAYSGLRMPVADWAAPDTAVKAACLAGLWELHIAACRVAHSVLAGGIPTSLMSSAIQHTLDLSQLVGLPLLAASSMFTCKEDGPAALPPDVAR